MAQEAMLSIGEVSRACGLRPSALRFYEEAGLITPAARVAGRRQYDRSVLDRLAIIALCQEVGFTVAEIVDFLGARAPRTRWRALADQKLAELDSHILRAKATRKMLRMALDCGCGDPAMCELVQRAAHRRRLRGPRRPKASRTPKASSMISQRLH